MPTGTQQVIEGLLCTICQGILRDERSDIHELVCLDCHDSYTEYCEVCDEQTFSHTLLTGPSIRALARLRLYTNVFQQTSDSGLRICQNCIMCCEECGLSYQYEDEMIACCQESEESLVHPYHYRPIPVFYSSSPGVLFTRGRAELGVLYMGAEIEVAKMGNSIVERFNEEMKAEGREFLYMKEDGSLGYEGVELVTMPATLDAFEKVFPFDALDQARHRGARSFNYESCGFHIHVSRSAFTPQHMWKFIKFQLNNPVLCQRIAQRENSNYATWYYEANDMQGGLPSMVKGKTSNHRRYLAINFQNRNTVELRYFKGNILRNAIMKNLEYVQSLYDYTKPLTVKDVMTGALKESEYIEWLDNQEDTYVNLKNFLANNTNSGE